MSQITNFTDPGAGRITPLTRRVEGGYGPAPGLQIEPVATRISRGTDQLDLSDRARAFLAGETDGAATPVRTDLVARMRGQIADGALDTDEKLDMALDRMISSLDLTA